MQAEHGTAAKAQGKPDETGARWIVAIMQPYLYPYAGYFRLLAEADEFVILDCVQFPRRGRVHRCQVPGPDGREEWLTLPLATQPRSTLIRDLVFADDARAELDRRLDRLRWLAEGTGPAAARVRAQLHSPLSSVAHFLEDGLRLVASLLELPARISRSSDLDIDPSLRRQERILAIARAKNATDYLNAPGGHGLYDAQAFASAGVRLHFQDEYRGRFMHLLPALAAQDPAQLRADVLGSRSSIADI
jgi:hypothetical protein